ncbi:MAG: hypothetical protein K9M49_07140 [Candidatus Marinimicrobia bacterium]|nr:hypothetical protein [Candidatus Neomarinimicrobiota bacterium]MCF7850714.1 hypothetical protein [Candidatus Neomarinimicrobiota bacterium]MCF7904915.1 hypothetical protein [Candidatus Neomarinimicrobiota bacterium]
MLNRRIISLVLILLIGSCGAKKSTESEYLGKFNIERDLYLAHFDLKTDVDDIHSAAAVVTMLADERFDKVNYHAVAGAYGTQGGDYVPANDLFKLAFGKHWSDAHSDFNQALEEVSSLATKVIQKGGKIWIADGGQSDFSAAVVREIKDRLPDTDIKNAVHIVQHADWNEKVTSPADLAFLKEAASYHRIPDGNGTGNGTPGFRSDELINWRQSIDNPRLKSIWEKAIEIANEYNGVDDRYLNESIMQGGLDFSDASETTWIFGFNNFGDANDFFREFATNISP